MPTVGFGRMNADTSHEQLVEIVAKQQKLLDYIFGGIDTKNIREIAGWIVSINELVSRDRDVGMSTEDTVADDVRFFAGAVAGEKETALFKVRKSGKMEATGAEIQSASGYPKIVMDPTNNLFAAYTNADNYVMFNPSYSGAPAFLVVDGGLVRMIVQYIASMSTILSPGSFGISVTAGDIFLDPGSGDFVVIPNWDSLKSESAAKTLQSELDDIWDAIDDLDARVSALEGP